jgi:hypothetical protein
MKWFVGGGEVTVFPLIAAHGRLFFNPKILKFFTLVPPYVCLKIYLKRGGSLLVGGRQIEHGQQLEEIRYWKFLDFYGPGIVLWGVFWINVDFENV